MADSEIVPEETRQSRSSIPDSPRRSLRERVQRQRDQRVKLLSVPDLDGVAVLYRAINDETRQRIAKQSKRRQGGKPGVGDPVADASVLVDACVGIFERVEGRWVSVDPDAREGAWLDVGDDGSIKVQGDPVTFASEVVQEMLGTKDRPTAETVRELYVTDGDMMAAAAAVMEHSGYSSEMIEEDIRGN